jgi:hypothetical protein
MPLADFPFHVLKAPGRTTAIPIGLAVGPTLDGSGLSSADSVDGSFLEHSAGASAPSGGIITSFDVTSPRWHPTVEFVVEIPALLTDLRCWIGLFAARPDDIANPQVDDRLAAFQYDSANPDWQIYANTSGAGAHYQTNITVAAGVHLFRIEVGPTSIQYFIDGAPAGTLTPDTNVSLLLGLGVRITRLTGDERTIRWSRLSWIHKV